MNIIFCYGNRPQSEVEQAVRDFAPDAEFCKTEGLYGYCDVIESHWNKGEDLVVIEGDKIITYDVIPSFNSCDKLWCSYSYPLGCYHYQEGLQEHVLEAFTGLGCIKYSARLQQAVPVEDFLHDDHGLWPPCPFCDGVGCWNYLDLRIAREVEVHFEDRVHIHGRLEHRHEYPRVTKISEIKDTKLRSDLEYFDSLAGPDWPHEG